MRSSAIPGIVAALLLTASSVMAEPATPICVESAKFAVPQRPYVAFRRLEADNPKSGKQGWMEVKTTVGRDGLLVVEVLSEGGSEQIRNKVLRAALESERNLLARRAQSHTTADPASYECAAPEPDGSGLLRVPLKPGSKGGDNIVIGHMFLEPSTGDVVRVSGRLARNPSFWISRVDIDWSYARVHNDIVLPVCVESTAKVKIFGVATFRMTYDYQSVDGQPIATAAIASR